jgi:plasmid stability protein
MTQRQTNIRLDDETFEDLEVAAFINRRSFPDELRAALQAWLDTFNKADLEAAKRLRRAVQKESKPAPVSSLDKKRKSRRRGD